MVRRLSVPFGTLERRVSQQLPLPESRIRNDVSVGVDISELTITLNTLLLMLERDVARFPIRGT
jgi:hypothetical protein